ncbi:glycoside hydrolase family 3 N-terminal domain-containing protein [Sphingobacterium olei]|nr:glycoside hydrolase family 3 N-terminal domain-containing protein [Sphingobacterium olei]
MKTRRKGLPVSLLLSTLMSISQSLSGQVAPPLYLRPDIPIEERLNDLMGRMNLEQKIAQMCQYVGLEHMRDAEKNISEEELLHGHARGFYKGLHSEGVERMVKKGEIGSFLHVLDVNEANHLQQLAAQSPLKIPLLIGIDAIHGNGLVRGSTIYPSPITMASSFAPALVQESYRQTAKEMRATGSHWAFSPNIEIARDPRWGRVGETYGEDPYLVTQMGIAAVTGLQGTLWHTSESVLACVKHLVAGGIGNNGTNASPVELGEGELRNVFLEPFKRVIQQAQPYTLMPAHNELNGMPCHVNSWLINDIIRNEYGFEGFVVSDWMDMEAVSTKHRLAEDLKEAFRLGIEAGVDMHMHGPIFMDEVKSLVQEGKITTVRIDSACAKILRAKFKLGLFENPYVDPNTTQDALFTNVHQQTSLEIARKGIVLLHNQSNVLPLTTQKRILVVGPNSNNQAMMGDWVFDQPQDQFTTLLAGIRNQAAGIAVDYVDVGWNLRALDADSIAKAIQLASKADIVIAAVGEDSFRQHWKEKTGGENRDRMDISLWGMQQDLLEGLKSTGTPLVAVLINGRPLATPWIAEQADAAIEAWEPGSHGGRAIAEILFGKVNPSGKLPMSIPRHGGQIPIYYNHKPSQFAHAFIDGPKDPLYPFGHGLSYTNFQYHRIECASHITLQDSLKVAVEVENSGQMDGEEVVQLYIRDDYAKTTRPVKSLCGFQRIALKKGEKKTVYFTLHNEVFHYYDGRGQYTFEPGSFTLMAGGSSAQKDLLHRKLMVSH